ncbi:Tropinone reductase like [Glycine soja]|uniref:Tropinone reductase like n=1 Tax=Glycine soja TaxID=3848 RepID=A0A0B2P8R6_GLYSO|nr:Tropinone reductase like [Glycine soja]
MQPLKKSTAEVHKMVVAMESQMTVGRLGEPKDISTPIAFLCLPAACDASYITSQIITVDGGSII